MISQDDEDTIYRADKPTELDENRTNSPKSKEDGIIDDVTDYDWGKHPNSIKALKKNQFPKGVSGNVLGRKPTFENLKNELKKLGEEETLNYKDESMGTRKEQVLKRIWFDATKGDMKKIQLLAWLGCLD